MVHWQHSTVTSIECVSSFKLWLYWISRFSCPLTKVRVQGASRVFFFPCGILRMSNFCCAFPIALEETVLCLQGGVMAPNCLIPSYPSIPHKCYSLINIFDFSNCFLEFSTHISLMPISWTTWWNEKRFKNKNTNVEIKQSRKSEWPCMYYKNRTNF